MRAYMPRHHHNFLPHLGAALLPLRVAVARMGDAALTEAYNAAVDALRRFRDAIFVSWRSTSLARRIAEHLPPLLLLGLKLLPLPPPTVAIAEVCAGQLSIGTKAGGAATQAVPDLLRGTGGTDLVKFLKGVRDRTSEAAFDCIRKNLPR